MAPPEVRIDMDRSLGRFLKEVEDRLVVLRGALEDVRRGSEEADASVRRIARSIGHAAGRFGLAEIQRCAEVVDASPSPQELLARARALLERAAGAPSDPGPAGRRVLVIEDDPVAATLLESMLSGEGCQVSVAHTAEVARGLIETRTFDLLLLDLILPDADGRDLLQWFRARPASADIPVIVSSGRKASQARPECLALGAQDYLEKPVHPDQVRAAVRRYLEPLSEEDGPVPIGPVLLVEDDPVTAKVILHRLAKEGMEVAHFQDGEAAHEGLSEGRFALAIFDVNLPGMSGFELLQRARELPHFRRTPVIMLTAMGREEDVVRGLELGANDYVMKPFSPVELVARIHRLLRD